MRFVAIATVHEEEDLSQIEPSAQIDRDDVVAATPVAPRRGPATRVETTALLAHVSTQQTVAATPVAPKRITLTTEGDRLVAATPVALRPWLAPGDGTLVEEEVGQLQRLRKVDSRYYGGTGAWPIGTWHPERTWQPPLLRRRGAAGHSDAGQQAHCAVCDGLQTRRNPMLDQEKERGRAIGRMPPQERNNLVARMMFGQAWEHAQMAIFMLMGAWGVAPQGPPPGHGGPPPEAGE
jgi:hypothetical protein